MDGDEAIIWFVLAFYIFFFSLFSRYFLWKQEAEREHWSRRLPLSREKLRSLAREKGLPVPFISILVPARGEALVIANTLRHLSQLEYPWERFEIVVITDEKEDLAIERGGQSGPSTRQVVEKFLKEEGEDKQRPAIRHVTVPYDYDGRLHGSCLGRGVASTKGRALNYGMGFLNPDAELCAFYDAESRPETQVLLYVAYRYLLSARCEQIWYGPVFQVRNYYAQGPVSKVGALYQCASHEWYIPVLMKRLPFVGGTNLFATRELVERVGGYDSSTLTEDVEFGVRVYCMTGHWPIYIPYWSTEQTPATYKAFFRQRLRWGSGHLQVTEKYRQAHGIYPEERRRQMVQALFWKGEGEWVLYHFALVVGLGIMLASTVDVSRVLAASPLANLLGHSFMPIYIGFTYYLYFRYRRYMDHPARQDRLRRVVIALAQLLLLPVVSPFLLFPYSWALILKWAHRQPQVWIKTPRTREAEGRAII